jgi:hypothetical protein
VTDQRLITVGDGVRDPLIRFRPDLIDFEHGEHRPGDTVLKVAVKALERAIATAPTQVFQLGDDEVVLVESAPASWARHMHDRFTRLRKETELDAVLALHGVGGTSAPSRVGWEGCAGPALRGD